MKIRGINGEGNRIKIFDVETLSLETVLSSLQTPNTHLGSMASLVSDSDHVSQIVSYIVDAPAQVIYDILY